ncbi:MAG TPA: hypothetical protein VFQ25_17385 [Ktedonobacterales bacterium]|nr:hypothetical protein [Ktedonobacterales bacterium]
MSEGDNDYRRFREATPEFFMHVERAFGFLENKYHFRIHSQVADALEYVQDANACMSYVGVRVEARIWWDYASAQMGVSFNELKYPRLSAANDSVFWGDATNRPHAIDLWQLADYLGHGDDPDFLLGHKEPKSYANFKEFMAIHNERAAIIYDNMAGVLDGLARLTERYARKILRGGDRDLFLAVWNRYAERMRALNAPAVDRRNESSGESAQNE